MKIQTAYRLASIRSGLTKFRKECRLTKDYRNRLVKAWRVPGTKEAGTDNMLTSLWIKEFEQIKANNTITD